MIESLTDATQTMNQISALAEQSNASAEQATQATDTALAGGRVGIRASAGSAVDDLSLDVPHPRAPEDDALFEIEKRVTRDFMRMEEEAS